MSLSFTRSAACSMGSKSMETLCFSQSPASGPHRYDPLCFPVHGAGVMFYRAWRWCHFCVRWALLSCFPALGDGVMFCPVWHLVMFSRASDRLHVGLVSDWLIAYVAFLMCHMATWVNFLLFVLIYKWD